MYKCKGSGLTVYETFDELLYADIINMYEYQSKYFIETRPEDFYDETVWVVDKQTEKVSFVHFVETFEIDEKDRIPIDPKELRKERESRL